MAAEAETLSVTPEPHASEPEENQVKPGITVPAVLVGLALLGILAVGLPHWSLMKDYPLGLGGYLPLEAFFLVLLVLVFNRFRGVYALVAGLLLVAALIPSWHEAVYARSEEAIKALGPLAHWLRTSEVLVGTIDGAQDVPGKPGFLLGMGCLLIFALGAVPTYLVSMALGFMRRRFIWREIAVVFVLLSVGAYSCKSIQWLVGLVGVPHKYDTADRNYKGRFLRPVPLEQQVLSDASLLDDLKKLEKDSSKIEGLPRFKSFKTYATLKALERLAASPSDAAARAQLVRNAWGAEARLALVELNKKNPDPAALKKELGGLYDAAKSQVHLNVREEALDALRADNPAGIPSRLVPYDLYRYDRRTPEGERQYNETKEAIKRYGKGWLKRAPTPPKIDVPRSDLFDFDIEKIDGKGFDASQDPVLKRLAGVSLDSLEVAAGKKYEKCRIEDVKKESLVLRYNLPEDKTKQSAAPTVDIRLKDLAADQVGHMLAEALRQHRVRYGEARERYLVKRAENRASEWDNFLGYWKGPLKWWMPLLVLFLLLQVFLAAILRRQWCDHEKLMFPHAEAVRALIEGEEVGSRARRVLSSRALWIGAGISAVIFMFQGFSNYYPAVPTPNLHQISLKTFLSDRPWSNMGKTLNILPYLVGLAYLLTAEVSLSIWFFALVNNMLRVATMAWGLPRQERWAIHGEVMNSDALYTGAMFVFVFWLIWGGRRHILYVLKRGLGLIAPDSLEKREPMSYPVAFWGFWLSLAGICTWFALAGVTVWVMAVILVIYLILLLLICRVVSEAGLVAAGLNWWPFFPHVVFCNLFGFGQGASFGKMVAYKDSYLSAGGAGKLKAVPCTVRAIGIFQFCWPSMLYHLQLTPFVLAGFKLTETEPRRKRLLLSIAVLGMFGAMALFLYSTMNTVFEEGADGVKVYAFRAFSWAFNNTLLRDVMTAERMWSPDGFRISMMGLGGIAMVGLLWLRSTFYWWPLHPLGFAAFGLEWGMWFSFFIGWLFKRTALAYGGGEFSQKIAPFFYGLIVGHLFMAALWAIVGLCGGNVAWVTGIIPASGF